MGSCGPSLLRLFLRLLGIPAALLALHLELGNFPVASLVHRLSRRLHRSTIVCMLKKDHEGGVNNNNFFGGGANAMDSTQTPHRPSSVARKRSMTLDNKERALSGASPTISRAVSGLPPSTPQTSTPAFDTPATTSTLSHPFSPRPSMPTHSRSMSHAGIVRQGKRLSLQFPIQPAAGSSSPAFSPRSRPQSWVPASVPSTPYEAAPSPTESNILNLVAAQERYVLELKEELAKAEGDLKVLKKQWITSEQLKKRNESRKVTQLQPLNTNLIDISPDQNDEDGSTLWMQKEMERRKALLNGTKTSQRKVFSGSRHLRTLSLLSPDKNYTPSFPQPLDLTESQEVPEESTKRPQTITRHTSPDIASHIADTVDDERNDFGGLPTIQKEALLRTGKQMASDFKDGLLTFIEDIRQATVGDEAAIGGANAGPASARGPPKPTRKASEGRPNLNRAASSRKAGTPKSGDIGDEFWKEHGLSEPKIAPTKTKTHANKNTHQTPQKKLQRSADDFEDWDSWDTPNDKYMQKDAAASSDESEEPSSPNSGPNSSRTSTRYHSQRHDSKASSLTVSSSNGPNDESMTDSKRSSIPWPDLVKLSPGNLKRTASHLMKEWEKNLTPPPESRDASHSSGDYIGRSGSPAGLP